MTYRETLRESAETAPAAFLKYLLQRSKFSNHLFLFVEEADDIRFYTHFLSDFDNIVPFSCGGRNGVRKVEARIAQLPFNDAIAYIVDHDLSEPSISEASGKILRTSMYSWESHASSPAVFEKLFSHGCYPRVSTEAAALGRKFRAATFAAYEGSLRLHSALLITSLRLSYSVGLSDWAPVQGADVSRDCIAPSLVTLEYLEQKEQELIARGATQLELDTYVVATAAEAPLLFAHGKVLHRITKRIVTHILQAHESNCLVNVSSPLNLVTFMPHDWEEIEYIRNYIKSKLPKAA